MRPGNRLAGRIKSGRQPIEIVRPIHIVLMSSLRLQITDRRRLCPGADVATILQQMNGAVHRLHRRMGQERHQIDGVKPLRRLR